MEQKRAQDARFVAALEEHRAAMFRVARAMLHTDADAEDAVSAATLAAYQHLHMLRSWDSVRPWLMRITVRAGAEAAAHAQAGVPRRLGMAA